MIIALENVYACIHTIPDEGCQEHFHSSMKPIISSYALSYFSIKSAIKGNPTLLIGLDFQFNYEFILEFHATTTLFKNFLNCILIMTTLILRLLLLISKGMTLTNLHHLSSHFYNTFILTTNIN